MTTYFYIITFHAQRIFVYPIEPISIVLRRTLEVVFLLYFWTVITGKSFHEIQPLFAYFLIGQGVNFIIMARRSEYGKFLRKAIKHGEFTMYLSRPVNTIAYTFCKTVGEMSLTFAISLGFVIAGILLASPTFTQLLLFPFLLLNACLISFAWNLFEGWLAFYITKVANITNTIRRVIEVLSGSLVPLYYFPDQLEKIAKLTPFPSMIYGATSIITEDLSSYDVLFTMCTSTLWALSLTVVMIHLWNRGIRQYEAIGI